jgi:hypothetical protein
MPVLEQSVAEFMERWKQHATNATIYPQPEGSPLLEARVGGRVIYLFDRVGPYVARHGEVRLVVHPVTETITPTNDHKEVLQPAGVSRLEATGTVVEVARGFVIVQARARLVVGVFDESWRNLKVGDWVRFSSLEPVHGFYLGRA